MNIYKRLPFFKILCFNCESQKNTQARINENRIEYIPTNYNLKPVNKAAHTFYLFIHPEDYFSHRNTLNVIAMQYKLHRFNWATMPIVKGENYIIPPIHSELKKGKNEFVHLEHFILSPEVLNDFIENDVITGSRIINYDGINQVLRKNGNPLFIRDTSINIK